MIGLVVGGILTSAQEPVYETHATIMIQRGMHRHLDPIDVRATVMAESEALHSPELIDRVIAKTGVDLSRDDVLHHLAITPTKSSVNLGLHFQANNAAMAKNFLDRLLDEYEADDVHRLQRDIDMQRVELKKQLAVASKEMNNAADDAQAAATATDTDAAKIEQTSHEIDQINTQLPDADPIAAKDLQVKLALLKKRRKQENIFVVQRQKVNRVAHQSTLMYYDLVKQLKLLNSNDTVLDKKIRIIARPEMPQQPVKNYHLIIWGGLVGVSIGVLCHRWRRKIINTL